jgi:predicted nucleic acid-binding protein
LSFLYAESSAVLRWLLGASDADRVQRALATAPTVVTSELTSTEVGRSLQRLVATGQVDADEGERAWANYSVASQHWHLYRVDDEILRRARQAFPREPLQTLDAIHLSTALRHALEVGTPSVLSADRRVRANAQALGFAIIP